MSGHNNQISFPNVDLVIKSIHRENIFSIDDIFSLLSVIRKYELGGEYIVSQNKFILDPKITHYDYDSDRPYTNLNLQTDHGVVWHSHPYGIKIENSYPSLEDLQVAREHPNIIFLIFTGRGVYIISLSDELTKEDIDEFYESMSDNNIESNFVNYEFTDDIPGLFLICVQNLSTELLNKYIKKVKKVRTSITS